MSNLMRLRLDDESSILIESASDVVERERFEPGISTTGSLTDLKAKSSKKLMELSESTVDQVLKIIIAFSEKMLGEFREEFIGRKNSEISIEYGVNFVGNLDVKLASASTEAAIKVTVSWKPSWEDTQ
jgi:hypothetical protein